MCSRSERPVHSRILGSYQTQSDDVARGEVDCEWCLDIYKVCMHTLPMAQKTSTVNISFRDDLLKEIDEVARSESRTRSELVREAARVYIERRRRMSTVIESIRETVRQRGITEEDVAAEIAAVRAETKQRR